MRVDVPHFRRFALYTRASRLSCFNLHDTSFSQHRLGDGCSHEMKDNNLKMAAKACKSAQPPSNKQTGRKSKLPWLGVDIGQGTTPKYYMTLHAEEQERVQTGTDHYDA